MLNITYNVMQMGIISLDAELVKAIETIRNKILEEINLLLPLFEDKEVYIEIRYLTGEKEVFNYYGFSKEEEQKVRSIINSIDYDKLLRDLGIFRSN